jgi:hypothetical protein
VAGRLRRALAESRQRFIVAQMATIRSLLSQEDYGAAAERQRRVMADLAAFVALLDPEQAAEELELLRRAESRIAALAERQARGVKGTRAALGTEGPFGELADEQTGIRGDGVGVLDDLGGAVGARELEAALEHMLAAEAALKQARGEDALEEQIAAHAGLLSALAQVRDAIRRLEEGAVDDIRSRLGDLLEEQLEAQVDLRGDALDLHSQADLDERARRLAAAELGRRQRAVVSGLEEAAGLVDEGGGSPALSTALAGATEDAVECARLLGEGVTERSVTDLQQDVAAVLRSLLGALEGHLAPAAEPDADDSEGEQRQARALLAVHAELNLLADLQEGLGNRTGRVEQRREPGAAVSAEVDREVERIARGQSRITLSLVRIDRALKEAGIQ